uniref:SUZ-C domain-containing protein n=1 Tax=Anolis carolinensis TaxID=28377 RepID=A0A803TR75_ANOCA
MAIQPLLKSLQRRSCHHTPLGQRVPLLNSPHSEEVFPDVLSCSLKPLLHCVLVSRAAERKRAPSSLGLHVFVRIWPGRKAPWHHFLMLPAPSCSSCRPPRISHPDEARPASNVIRQPLGPDGSQGFRQRR